MIRALGVGSLWRSYLLYVDMYCMCHEARKLRRFGRFSCDKDQNRANTQNRTHTQTVVKKDHTRKQLHSWNGKMLAKHTHTQTNHKTSSLYRRYLRQDPRCHVTQNISDTILNMKAHSNESYAHFRIESCAESGKSSCLLDKLILTFTSHYYRFHRNEVLRHVLSQPTQENKGQSRVKYNVSSHPVYLVITHVEGVLL